MKNLLLLLIFTFIISCIGPDQSEKTYCGIILEKGYEMPTSGYKSSQNAKYFLIIRDTECNKTIRIDVTVPRFYDCKVGDSACFILSGIQLRDYGNSEGEHLK